MKTNAQLDSSAPTLANTMLGAVHFRPAVKVCSNCKETFEKNNNNFFEKQDSYIIKDGSKVYFKKLSAVCKKCHGKIATEKNRQKRCQELDCTPDEYKQKVYEIISQKKTKIPEAKHIKNYALLLRRVAKGYVFTTIEQYNKDKEQNLFRLNKLKRKMNYPECSKISELSKEEINKAKQEYNNQVLPRAVIANRLRLKLNDCPNEVIETQRLIIQINQILNKK
jgi:hypothetical protein